MWAETGWVRKVSKYHAVYANNLTKVRWCILV
jgi:hypothetical protein